MPELQPPSSVESIRRTLETFDPENRSILIGGAAIHWFLASRDCDVSRIPLRDVDVFASDQDLRAIHENLNPATFESATVKDKRLLVIPSEEVKRNGVCTFDVISDSDSYDDPLVRTKFNGRIYARDAISQQLVMENDGVRYLNFPFICWWKMSVGRESDVTTVQSAIIALCENGAVWSNELGDLRLALQRAEAGETFTGEFMYSDDPDERKEQLVERGLDW